MIEYIRKLSKTDNNLNLIEISKYHFSITIAQTGNYKISTLDNNNEYYSQSDCIGWFIYIQKKALSYESA